MSDSISRALTASGLPWKLRSENENLKTAMCQHHGISPLLASVLAGRNVALDDVTAILHPSVKTALPDPSHLLDMDKATARIADAIMAKKRISIFGDYDVDGATSSAQLSLYLSALSVPHRVYIPDRAREGYGPNIAAFDALIDEGATLILTLDCGTLAYEPINHANARGVDVIVIDHHVSETHLPDACAIVNPNRYDETSAHTNLCAAGVVFLVLVSLNRHLRNAGYFAELPEPDLLSMLDLVALGTVCDVMTLTGLNRAFVSQGLKVMATRARISMHALAEVARMNETPNVYHLGFLLGPRINAGGRVGAADLGVRLLTSTDEVHATQIARTLDAHNAERQAIETGVLHQALQLAEAQANMPVLMVANEGWHEGVIGIVAGRLKEKFARPALVVSLNDTEGKGSGRSVPGADLGSAMHHAQHLGHIIKGGGHAMAAGFSLKRETLESLHSFLCDHLANAVAQYGESRCHLIDCWLDASSITTDLLADIARGAPYGLGFASPRIALKEARIAHHSWMKEKHLKLRLSGTSGGQLDAVAFNVAGTPLAEMLMSHSRLHLLGEAKGNNWQGRSKPQFIIHDAMIA